MIIDELKKANIQAMKDRNQNAKAILGIVIAKHLAASIDKRAANQEMTDADMAQIISKTVKELAEEASNYEKAGKAEMVALIKEQSKVIEKFLPQMLSEKEIADIINKQADKSMPNIMKLFKTEYAGKVDMRLVQETLKKI